MALFCPHCGYNLTGLPTDRCPECGHVFDLRAIALEQNQPVLGLGGVLWRLMALPALFTASAALFIPGHQVIREETVVGLMVISGLILLAAGPFVAWRVAKKLLAGRRRGAPTGIAVFGCTVGLYLCQLALGFGGCTCCVFASM